MISWVYWVCISIWISLSLSFFFNDTATTEIYTLSLHDALPIYGAEQRRVPVLGGPHHRAAAAGARDDLAVGVLDLPALPPRSEERRVGKECSSRWSANY